MELAKTVYFLDTLPVKIGKSVSSTPNSYILTTMRNLFLTTLLFSTFAFAQKSFKLETKLNDYRESYKYSKEQFNDQGMLAIIFKEIGIYYERQEVFTDLVLNAKDHHFEDERVYGVLWDRFGSSTVEIASKSFNPAKYVLIKKLNSTDYSGSEFKMEEQFEVEFIQGKFSDIGNVAKTVKLKLTKQGLKDLNSAYANMFKHSMSNLMQIKMFSQTPITNVEIEVSAIGTLKLDFGTINYTLTGYKNI